MFAKKSTTAELTTMAAPVALAFLPTSTFLLSSRYTLRRRSKKSISVCRVPLAVGMAARRNTRSWRAETAATQSDAVNEGNVVFKKDEQTEELVSKGLGEESDLESESSPKNDGIDQPEDNSWLFSDDIDSDPDITSRKDELLRGDSSNIDPNEIELTEEDDIDDSDELPVFPNLVEADDDVDVTESFLKSGKSDEDDFVDDDIERAASNKPKKFLRNELGGEEDEGDIVPMNNVDDSPDLENDDDLELADDEDESVNFEDDVEPVSSLRSQRGYRSPPGRASLIDEPDENDDIVDDDDLLNPVDGIGYEEPLDDVDDEVPLDDEDDDTIEDGDDDVDDVDDFDAESEEDIQSAADILTNRGLLGLGVEKGGRKDTATVKRFALGMEDSEGEGDEAFEESDEEDDESLGLGNIMDDEDDDAEEIVDEADDDVTDGLGEDDKGNDIDDYPDLEDGDNEVGLTSHSNIGRIWELNEDTYVTITEPGQSFGYELDEDDQEDQDMATMRRGKHGGWSGGLASYPASDLPEGSREWVARRSYELMMKSSYIDMNRWAKRHLDPPEEIASLYPDDPPPATPLGRSTLKISAPPAAVTLIGQPSDLSDNVGDLADFEETEIEDEEHALDRSIKFPCKYKFKVEGDIDDEFIPSVRATTEEVLGRRVLRSAFSTERVGRYQRVTILVVVQNARQVTDLYDALRSNPLVRFSYG